MLHTPYHFCQMENELVEIYVKIRAQVPGVKIQIQGEPVRGGGIPAGLLGQADRLGGGMGPCVACDWQARVTDSVRRSAAEKSERRFI